MRSFACLVLLLVASLASAQAVLDRVDDFQDGTTMSWAGGSSPTNIPNGGPTGNGDKYLQIAVNGGFLASYNISRWSGNYTTIGVGRIEAQFKNFGQTDLTIRLVLFGTNGDRWSSNASYVLPSGGSWTQASFTLAPAGFTRTVGTGSFTTLMGSMDRIMFRHEPVIVPGGTTVTGMLGIDNVVAKAPNPFHVLTVQSSNPNAGVPITVWKTDLNSQGNGITAFTRNYNPGFTTSVTAPLMASGNTRTFDKWLKDGVSQGTLRTLHVLMDAPHTIVAVYKPVYTVTFTSANPSSGVPITVYQADLNNQKNGTTQFTRQYGAGHVVSMTAPAMAAGNYFMFWQKDGVQVGNAKTVTIAVNSSTTMHAFYIAGRTLTVESTGASNVPITVYKKDLQQAQNGTTNFTRIYAVGTSVGLTAPANSGGKVFQHWRLNGVQQGTAKTITVNMSDHNTVTAVYQ